MIPIGGLIQLGLSFYYIDLSVRHIGYQKDEDTGRDERVAIRTTTIKAAVDPSNSETMERIFGGSISTGDIGVFTTATLYIEDAAADGASYTGRKQSFVTYQGLVYRVHAEGNWTEQVGVKVYLCKRYLSQDDV